MMMSLNSAEISHKWNTRYTTEGAAWTTRQPNQLLTDYAHLLPSDGLALDAGAGVGNNSMFLAKRGLHVIALDISETGLQFLNRRRKHHQLAITPAVTDLAQPWLPDGCFDVIVNFNFLERALFPFYKRALKPNGLLFFSTFIQPTAEQPKEPFFLKQQELNTIFHDFIHLHDSQTSYFHKRSGTVRHIQNFIAKNARRNKS